MTMACLMVKTQIEVCDPCILQLADLSIVVLPRQEGLSYIGALLRVLSALLQHLVLAIYRKREKQHMGHPESCDVCG